MTWLKTTRNAGSPYPEDRRAKYVSGDYEITKEGDGCYWLRLRGKPIGMGPLLREAKLAAERHAAGEGASA